MATDKEKPTGRVWLGVFYMPEWIKEPTVLDYGMIVICRCGNATLRVNFDYYDLKEDTVITLFPKDVVAVTDLSDDFATEALRYDASILREASLQLEQTVYSKLRQDRCRGKSKVVVDIINGVFSLLKIYFVQEDCNCLEQLVLLQLKAFFVGFYDYLSRFKDENPEETGSVRMRELFNTFMALLEENYRLSRDVKFYAAQMNITPKYLYNIVSAMTGHNVKTIIDHFAVLQLKLTLRNSAKTVKEVAWEYHFSDVSFLCRYFKQHTGLTPQQFRQGL